jgi:hypothetical protein
MQTKSSHRALKWTLFMGLAASLASACVVSTGDGDPDDVDINGGDGGTTNNTSGTKNTGGTKAGTSNGGGGSSAGTTTAGTTSGGGEGGDGAAPYVPGACQDSLETASMLPSCDAKADDNDCGACLKVKCCNTLQECYGTEPTSACGYGATSDEDLGQFDCILACYKKNADGIKSQAEVVTDCAGECANQCADVGDGLINEDTQALLDCAQNGEDGDMDMGTDDCNDACFPAPM